MPTIYGGIMEKECSSLLKKFLKIKVIDKINIPEFEFQNLTKRLKK